MESIGRLLGKYGIPILLSLLILITIIVTCLSPFYVFFLMQDYPDLPLCPMALGAGAVVVLLEIAVYIFLKYPIKLMIAVLAIGVILGILAFIGGVCFLLYLFGESFDHDFPGPGTYIVSVSGLDNCTGTGHTTILVPVPVLEGKPVFDERYAVVKPGSWTAGLVDTDLGAMISLTTNATNLSDVRLEYRDIPLNGDYDQRYAIVNRSFAGILYPVSRIAPVNYTVLWNASNERGSYYTMVYLDGEVQPVTGNDSGINCFLGYSIDINYGKGHRVGPVFATHGRVVLPYNYSGWSPVRMDNEMKSSRFDYTREA